MEALLTTADAAELLRVSERTLRKLVALPDPKRCLPSVFVGGQRRFRPRDLEDWVARQAVHSQPITPPRSLRRARREDIPRHYDY